jgi:hypothetical protein
MRLKTIAFKTVFTVFNFKKTLKTTYIYTHIYIHMYIKKVNTNF